MKKKHFNSLLIASFPLIFFSCNGNLKNSDSGYYFEDFDNLKMWANDQLITDEQAHSGNFSSFTNAEYEFSQTFEMDFNYALSKGYKSVSITAWCYMSSPDSKASFVVSVQSADKTLMYDSTELITFLKAANIWGKVTKSIKLPEKSPSGAKIKVYVWSPKKDKTFLDDVEIQFSK